MPNQLIKTIIVTLLFLFSQPLWAGEIESVENADLRSLQALEAQLIYEEAVKQVVDGEYDKALKRLDWLISVYSETTHGQLATDKREEVAILLQQPKNLFEKEKPTQKLMFMLNHWSSKILT